MRFRLILSVALLGSGCAPSIARGPVQTSIAYDVVISNGRVVDGTGNPWYYGDVGVAGDRIVFVGPTGSLSRARAKERVDATGMVIAPGFIDIQSHSWGPLLTGDGRVISKVTQGVTSEILGESTTPAPANGKVDSLFTIWTASPQRQALQPSFRGPRGYAGWLAAMERNGNSVNVGSYLGATTVRVYAKGQSVGSPTPAELDTMRAVVRNAMEDGAFGISTALIYPPGVYASTDELSEMARAMAPYSGTYITHVRSEGDQLLEAIDEALEIGRRGGVPVVIYHLKASSRRNWAKSALAVSKIDSARRAGQDVTATMYPYPASGNDLSSCIPDWASADGKLMANLRDSTLRARIVADMLAGNESDGCAGDGPGVMMVVGFQKPELRRFEGLRLDLIADSLGRNWAESLVELTLLEEDGLGKLNFRMSEENVARQLAQPWVVIGSDAGGHNPETARGLTHPRAYGTFARILGKYVRDENVLRLEDAVRKMTSASAQILGIRDRGLLREGMFADVVVFDPVAVRDLATYDKPHQNSIGVRDVWVNGVRVLHNGSHTGAKPGRALRGPGWRRTDHQ